MKAQGKDPTRQPMRPVAHARKVAGLHSGQDQACNPRSLGALEALEGVCQEIQVAMSVDQHRFTLHSQAR